MYIYTYTVHCFDRITDDKQFVSTTLWMSEWCKQIANKVVHPGGLLERSLGEIQNLSSPMVPQKTVCTIHVPKSDWVLQSTARKNCPKQIKRAVTCFLGVCYFCLLRGYDSVVAKPSSSQGTLTWVKLRIGYALFQWIVMLVSWFLPNPCDWRSVDLEFLRYEFLGQAEVRGVFGFKTAATLFGAPILNNYNKPINTHEVLWFWGHFFKN